MHLYNMYKSYVNFVNTNYAITYHSFILKFPQMFVCICKLQCNYSFSLTEGVGFDMAIFQYRRWQSK